MISGFTQNIQSPVSRDSKYVPPLDVRSQVCHAHVPMAVRCLKSFQRYCLDPHILTLHDDGSLTPDDISALHQALPDARIILRAEARERVAGMLHAHPATLAFQRDFVFGPKLIDIPLLARASYAYIDDDILFIRPFRALTRPRYGRRMIVFMRDIGDSYSLTFRQRYLGKLRIVLPDRVNAGFMYINAGSYDLDRVEWFLSQPQYHVQKFLIEQTAWALLAGASDAFYWNPEQVCFPDEIKPLARPVAVHFITPLRKLMEEFGEAEPEIAPPPIDLEVCPARFTGMPKAFLQRIFRSIG